MSLEGTLDAFSLPDVLALLAMTKKTGVLRLHRHAGPPGAVQVRDGLVVAASSDDDRQALVRRIVATGLVDLDGLEPAVDAVLAGRAPSVIAALVAAGAVTTEVLGPLARDQVTDAVFELLRWSDGRFTFHADAPAPGPAEVALAADDVVAEGRRRLAAWSALAARLPTATSVLMLSPSPPGDPVCSREEWSLLAQVNGSSTVAELVARSGRGEWEIVSLLATLLERGLLTPAATSGSVLRREELLDRLEGQTAPVPVAPEPAALPVPVSAPEPEPVLGSELVLGSRPVLAERDELVDDAEVHRALLLRLVAGAVGATVG